MIPGFESIVEERIKKAQKDGEFENLPGTNKPLKFEDQNVPEEFRLSYKILKNSGFLPPEIELKKKITHAEQLLENVEPDSPERRIVASEVAIFLAIFISFSIPESWVIIARLSTPTVPVSSFPMGSKLS